jgi:tRNA-guanine family transglycosylase
LFQESTLLSIFDLNRSYLNGDKILLTPESSIRAQKNLRSDIIIPLDILLPLNVSKRKFLESFHRTHRSAITIKSLKLTLSMARET